MGKMNRALVVFTVAFTFVSAVLMRRNAKQGQRFEFRKADWESYEYQLRPAGSGSRFNVELQFEATAPPVDFRALVNCQSPQSYYYVEFAEGEVRLGRVEQELELRIGTRQRVSVDDGQVHHAVIKRRDASLVVALDGELVAQAFDSTFSGGQIGLGRRRRSVDFGQVRVQPVGDVYFRDDFMRAESDESPWEVGAGRWRVCSLNNPSLSSNAFSYVGRGASHAASVAGERFWDNYRAEVACRPRSTAAFGLHFCYRDPDNHFLFKWDGSSADPKAQIVRTRNGQSTVAAETPGGFLPDQWYRLRADVTDGHATVYVDDNPTLAVSDASLCFGKIGLYTEDAQKGTEFDDVSVQGWRVFQDDFERVCVGRWIEMGGKWHYIADGAAGGGGLATGA